jgi:hypothetical protein
MIRSSDEVMGKSPEDDDLEPEYDFSRTVRGKYHQDYISPQPPLGSRLAARFAGLGLTEDIPELRGEEARPAHILTPEDSDETVREILLEERRQRAIRKVALRNAAGRIEEAP